MTKTKNETAATTVDHVLAIKGNRTGPLGYGLACSCGVPTGFGYARQSDVKRAHAAHVAQAAAGII